MNHELEKFISVVELGSFSKAARKLYISQPALTQAIKSLEKKYGQLLIRNTRPLGLTQVGLAVYSSALKLRGELNQLAAEVRRISENQPLRQAFGAIDTIAQHILKTGINADKVEVHVDNSARLMKSVEAGRLNFACIVKPLQLPKGLAFQPLAREPFMLVARPDHIDKVKSNLIQHKHIENFASYNDSSLTFQAISRFLAIENITYKTVFASTSPELIRQVVLTNHNAALLPSSVVKSDINQGQLVAIDNFNFSRNIVLVHRFDKSLSETSTAIIKSVSSIEN